MAEDVLLQSIKDRLPELAWKTSLLPHRMTLHALPKNLFKISVDSHPSDCVNEIKDDLLRLLNTKQFSQEYAFLVRRLEQKIEVLVRLCQVEKKKQSTNSASTQLMMRLCHRRQWVEELEANIEALQCQHHHLQAQLIESKDTQIQLTMQSELGKLEQKITILKEKLTQTAII